MTTINLDLYHKFIYSSNEGAICPFCQGTGLDHNYRICLTCEGKGYLLIDQQNLILSKLLFGRLKNMFVNYLDINFLKNYKKKGQFVLS